MQIITVDCGVIRRRQKTAALAAAAIRFRQKSKKAVRHFFPLALPFPHKILKKQVPKNFGKNCLMREKRENRATRPSLFDACERIIIKSNSTLLRVIPK